MELKFESYKMEQKKIDICMQALNSSSQFQIESHAVIIIINEEYYDVY